jgi:broad specificity phosphatase PhoE
MGSRNSGDFEEPYYVALVAFDGFSLMALILLVRHGQAAFGTEDYDRLSDLGRQQARWLGQYLLERGIRPVAAVSGSLRRQRDTAAELLGALGSSLTPAIDPGLNEYEGDALYACHTGGADHRVHQQRDARDYWRTFRAAMQAWADDALPGMPESWIAFGARVRAAVDAAIGGAGRDDPVLVVSSGGAIGRLVADIMSAPASTAIELNLQFRNTGLCELIAGARRLRLLSYNNVPHLDHPERRHGITFA